MSTSSEGTTQSSTAVAKPVSTRVESIASVGIFSSDDYLKMTAAAICDVASGSIAPSQANAIFSGHRAMLKHVDLSVKVGRAVEGGRRILELPS